jgi:hypothetical protein
MHVVLMLACSRCAALLAVMELVTERGLVRPLLLCTLVGMSDWYTLCLVTMYGHMTLPHGTVTCCVIILYITTALCLHCKGDPAHHYIRLHSHTVSHKQHHG